MWFHLFYFNDTDGGVFRFEDLSEVEKMPKSLHKEGYEVKLHLTDGRRTLVCYDA